MYNVLYFDLVFSDIQEAKIWYKEQKNGLEVEFGNAIETAIKQIVKMPFSFAPRYKNVRIAHAKRFPYNIHFYIDETENIIIITAVVHNKQKEAIAKQRI